MNLHQLPGAVCISSINIYIGIVYSFIKIAQKKIIILLDEEKISF